ncbi:MAG: NADH-quinone oxidoreductase subunit M [Acidobacteriota bacterium]
MFEGHLLSLLFAIPAIGAVLCLLVPKGRDGWIRGIAAVISVISVVLMPVLWRAFAAASDDFTVAGFLLLEERSWIPRLGIHWRLGIDGISLLLLELTLLLLPLVVMASWKTISHRVREYYCFLLLLQAGMIGVFMALDAILFYVFWEVMLVPMYFLIGIWGSKDRLVAAIKFFLYTMVGSVLMLLALFVLYFQNEAATGTGFDIRGFLGLQVPAELQGWLFLAFFAAFAIKVPLFPFHTWLPAAHGQAPTAGSVILAGVLLKMGTYGFVRLALPILPEATRAALPWLLGLCVVGVIYGALTAMAQSDMKQLVAYSSISHLGLVMLGIFCLNPNGLSGGLLQMINHGLSTGALFLLVGMLYERRHTKEISAFKGLAQGMPVFTVLFLIATLASIGLPGLNGFVGEFTILAGAIELAQQAGGGLNIPGFLMTALAATGVVLGAVYMLWLVRRICFGPTDDENAGMKDVQWRSLEFWSVVPLLVLCLYIGLHPKPLFKALEVPVRELVAVLQPDYTDPPPVTTALSSDPPPHDGSHASSNGH